ncbi:MAG: Rrf2 family transcriptional regulator [Acidobacteria bacterium]|nr:Rrf2 family transcriptional regulator [Acidobacteriota bacterium]MCB9397484.1 Rrf2 family transcriptional regulator [Acidobacteriota bacterium]
MHLNKATRFALYAVTELARSYPEKQTVQEIAERYGASEHHLSKVMQLLSRFQIVEAVRGVGGGYRLAISPKALTVMDIIKIVEPQFITEGCQLNPQSDPCAHSECSIHELFDEVARQIRATFSAVSIDTLAHKHDRKMVV